MKELYEFFMVEPSTLPEALRAARQGVQSAQMSIDLIRQTFNLMQKEPLSCMCRDCEAEFNASRPPGAFVVVVPMFPRKGSEGISCIICSDCMDRPDLAERVQDALREIWPGRIENIALHPVRMQ